MRRRDFLFGSRSGFCAIGNEQQSYLVEAKEAHRCSSRRHVLKRDVGAFRTVGPFRADARDLRETTGIFYCSEGLPCRGSELLHP